MKKYSHNVFKRFGLIVVFLVLVALTLFALNDPLGLRKERNAFTEPELNRLLLSIKANNTDEINKVLINNPQAFKQINMQLSAIETAKNIDDIPVGTTKLLEFIFELSLSKNKIENSLGKQKNADFNALINANLTESFDAFLKHTENNNHLSLEQERLLAVVIKLKALQNRENSIFNSQYFASRYKREKPNHSKFGVFSQALLQASWLSQLSQKNQDIESFHEVREGLKSDSDLVRFLGHKNDLVVIIAATLIHFYRPENAMHALRFQLIRSNNTTTKVALLDALATYGMKARSATKQLKRLLQTTKSDLVRKKIQETIAKLNGKFEELYSKK